MMKERRRQLFSLLLSLALLLALVPVATIPAAADELYTWSNNPNYYNETWYDADNPQSAYTLSDDNYSSATAKLAGLAYLVNEGTSFEGVTITLGSDVDLSAHLWAPIGTEASPFKGTFEGGGHTVSGMRCGTSGTLAGLFGVVNSGTIQNVTVSGTVAVAAATPAGDDNYYVYVGGVAARMDGSAALTGCVNRCTVTVMLHGAKNSYIYVGGVAGQVDSGSAEVLGCSNEGSVSLIAAAASGAAYDISKNNSYVGGVAGESSGLLDSCRNTASVAATVEAAGTDPVTYAPAATSYVRFNLGGVAGNGAGGATIVNCVNTGSVTSAGSVANLDVRQGGVVGALSTGNTQTMAVRNSYNLGAVTRTAAAATANVGGVAGFFSPSCGSHTYLENCYSAASSVSAAEGANVGGIIGKIFAYASPLAMSNCYWLASGTTGGIGVLESSVTAAACGFFADENGALTAGTTAQGFPDDQTIPADTTLLAALNAWVTEKNAATTPPTVPFAAWYAPSMDAGVSSPYPGFTGVLTLDAAGGACTETVLTIGRDGKVTSLPDPSRSGYAFDGWFTAAEGGDAVTADSVFTSSQTIYAHWTENTPPTLEYGVAYYTLRFEVNGGSNIDAIRRAKNTTVDLSAYTTTREGYTFGGWYADEDLTEPVTSVKLTRDEVVYAKWTWNNPFSDVPDDADYKDAVEWALEQKITTGVSANTFDPSGVCTRGQMAAFLWRAAGSPEPTSAANPFTDVSADAFCYKAVLWAVEKGIAKGTGNGTTFSPNDVCTRGQMAAFLYRAAGSPAVSGESKFTDVADHSAFYYDAVLWAAEQGITQGTSATTFSPNDICYRCQIVTFLYRFIVK